MQYSVIFEVTNAGRLGNLPDFSIEGTRGTGVRRTELSAPTIASAADRIPLSAPMGSSRDEQILECGR